ncbi:hypothetical protein [Chitinilyticum litopenaei]|uniref:hypothetical protein n=1 Tax=Chitinilyticum litopenaei TaxID=1121276 RepID=UPI000410C87E|nr:hypothetical protein [Chitinilyticum litopenaei]
MTDVPIPARYRCGHVHEPREPATELDGSCTQFACPACQLALAVQQGKNTRAYVNMQQISTGMASFVIEISEATAVLGELLATQGFARSTPSQDELHPGNGLAATLAVIWRKEFQFAVDIHPEFVLALMEVIKNEVRALSAYFPAGEQGVSFMAFPGDDAGLDHLLFVGQGGMASLWADS